MARLTLLFLFGATCLPGFLSDPFDPKTAYSIENPFYNSYETDHIISYELIPLNHNKLREKRQAPVTVTLPPQEPETQENKKTLTKDKNEAKKPIVPDTKSNLQSFWGNATRQKDANPKTDESNTPLLENTDTGKTLLRSATNVFTNNGSSTELPTEGIHVPLGNDSVYPNLPEFPPDYNKTLTYENNSLTTEQDTDDFKYYVTQHLKSPNGTNYWVDLNHDNATKHEMLSDAHRRAATLKPKFEFLFYGHPIYNLTVATGGFIYLGDQVHAWLAATQYIAPLMANFDTSNSKNSTVKYLSADTFFTVEWNEVQLQDSPETGLWTFQTSLYKNGTIVFVYKNLPIPIREINDTNHPVKVGLSDAYIRDRSVFVIKQKTIYEYHRIDLKEHYVTKQNNTDQDIENGSVIIFTPQDTCLKFRTCEECTTSNSSFQCGWCPKLNRCSDGFDRKRQEWTQNSCDKEFIQVQHSSECPNTFKYNSTPSTHPFDNTEDTQNSIENHQQHYQQDVQKVRTADTGGTSASGVLAILFFVIIVFASVGWVVYAYLYPHTPSGQLLIRYRPTQWAFRRGEARYTAASIHM